MVLSRPLISFIYGGGAFDDFSVSIQQKLLRAMYDELPAPKSKKKKQ